MAVKKSVALSRHVQGYPNQREYNLYVSYMEVEGLSQTDALTDIFRVFFASMSEAKRKKYTHQKANAKPEHTPCVSWPL